MGSTQSKSGEGAFFVGAFLGGLIGAALAVWYAPRSGEDTRQMVFQQGDALATRLERMVVGERPADALAEGKALAQQRQIELSLDE
jgi:gas vesicle protein